MGAEEIQDELAWSPPCGVPAAASVPLTPSGPTLRRPSGPGAAASHIGVEVPLALQQPASRGPPNISYSSAPVPAMNAMSFHCGHGRATTKDSAVASIACTLATAIDGGTTPPP